jgi:RimJ/RimL family protein N-acetyltransferase
VRSIEDARRYIREGPAAGYERHGYGLLRVALLTDDMPIGMCGVLKRDTLPEPDLGFSFLPAYWSMGYAFESAGAVMRHARAALHVDRILAITTHDNLPSMRLLGKLGFRFERMIRLGDDPAELRMFSNEP